MRESLFLPLDLDLGCDTCAALTYVGTYLSVGCQAVSVEHHLVLIGGEKIIYGELSFN